MDRVAAVAFIAGNISQTLLVNIEASSKLQLANKGSRDSGTIQPPSLYQLGWNEMPQKATSKTKFSNSTQNEISEGELQSQPGQLLSRFPELGVKIELYSRQRDSQH
jgi:hypothetical protein